MRWGPYVQLKEMQQSIAVCTFNSRDHIEG